MRAAICLLLTVAISLYTLPQAAGAQVPVQELSLAQLIEQPYVFLFQHSPELNFSKQQIESFRKELEKEKNREKQEQRQRKRSLERQIEEAQARLKRLNEERSTPAVEKERHQIHCLIQKLRKDLEETKLVLEQGLDTAYENKFAKLRILEEWPRERAQILQRKMTGEAAQRKFGDFRDVGFRGGVFEGQEKDIKDGREAITEMRRLGLLPPEVEDEQVVGYVRNLAARIARHSDLRVPLSLAVLKSQEINAFALPGGFLFVNTGLLEKAENEAELAGVLAHEIAHVAARHGHRLMTKASIASIIFQAAQLAALIFTGGVASIGTYYALQYGFYGLGLVLNLSLLGVSRDYELEADILGTQYLWHSGYHPEGFINFFDRMAQEKGYVTGLSWFRTHPPFYERMSRTYEEILLLPEQEEPLRDSAEFRSMKERLKEVLSEMKARDRQAPTLRVVYDCEGESGQ